LNLRDRLSVSIILIAATTLSGCASNSAPRAEDVPVAEYIAHLVNSDLEALHRIQINDIAGLRKNLEDGLGTDVLVVWATIEDKQTSPERRQRAYGLLRLMAVQNEHFPVTAWNSDPEVLRIFKAALDENPAHAEQLRRQDWSKPKWVNWVQ